MQLLSILSSPVTIHVIFFLAIAAFLVAYFMKEKEKRVTGNLYSAAAILAFYIISWAAGWFA